MAQQTKFRSPSKGYSRVTIKEHTSHAVSAAIELDPDPAFDSLPQDGIAQMMADPDSERRSKLDVTLDDT